MNINQIERHYLKFYESIDFERFGLFKCARKEFGEREVAYLGSSAHVTPSFVFSNVTYVDNGDMAKEFFLDEGTVTTFIERRKVYKRKVNIRFIDADYTNWESQKKYDLVIAIFSPGVFTAAQEFLKKDSLLLYLSLPTEKNIHGNNCGLKAVGSIHVSKGKYRYSREVIENTFLKKDMIDNRFQDVYAYSLWGKT